MQIIPAGTANTVNAVNPNSFGSQENDTRPHSSKSGQASQKREQFAHKTERVPIDEAELIQVIEHANTSLEGAFTQFEFSIHEKTKEIMVKVIDRESGEVIREIPPEQILDMVAKMWELAGILVDERI